MKHVDLNHGCRTIKETKVASLCDMVLIQGSVHGQRVNLFARSILLHILV